ncbi:MAG: fibrobacter succinogenes major paralogous domain-containing protein, partial [Dysgonamonadaceae bacterium]|nr:fibrobacter succinogenes major paralogous domain-containing protein [Dysgonamonadaceae bacterium]
LSSLNGVSSYNDLNTVFDPDVDLTDDSAPDPLMFLPAAGFRLGNSTYETLDVTDTGSFGYYWSSTVGDDSSWKQSYLLLLSRFNVRLSGGSRVYGASVRCIKVL